MYYNEVRPYSELGYLITEEFATAYANVKADTAFYICTDLAMAAN